MRYVKKTKSKSIISKNGNGLNMVATPFIAAVRSKKSKVLSSKFSCNSIESWDGDDGGRG